MLKKDEPQIIANKINRDKSKVFASLISSLNCIYVINAYLLYIFNYTLKRPLIYMFFSILNEILLRRLNEFKKRFKTYEGQASRVRGS